MIASKLANDLNRAKEQGKMITVTIKDKYVEALSTLGDIEVKHFPEPKI